MNYLNDLFKNIESGWNMEIKYLYAIKKIVELGSYQKAASALNYAQSTITFQVKQVEQELSLKMFEKIGNKMQLTSVGREIFPQIENIINETEKLIRYSNKDRELNGELLIAVPESLITYKLQHILEKFKKKAPKAQLRIKVMNCYEIHRQVTNGEVDIAIHYEVQKYPNNINTSYLGTYELGLIASPNLDIKARDFISSEQKKEICHIENDSNALYLKIFNQYLKNKKITLSREIELWSIESIKQCVMSNLGVAFLPLFTVEEQLKENKLIKLKTDIDNNTLTAVYAYNKNKWVTPEMRLFLDILNEKSEIV